MEFLTADGQVTAPPTAESTIGRPATDVDIDYVVSKMARTAGRLQATAEQCSGESEPEIRAEFVEASSNRFPDDIAAIEQAFDRHYEDRKSKLASKKKNRCRQKEHNRMNKENDFNVDLLAENSES